MSTLNRLLPVATGLLAAFLVVPSQGLAQVAPPKSQADQKAEEMGKKVLADISAMEKEMVALRVDLLGPVDVNGQRVSADQVRREAVFLVGATQLELKILEFIVEEWKQRMLKEGRKPEEFKIDDAAIEAEIKQNLNKFRTMYPNLNFWDVVRAQTGLSKEQHLRNSRVTHLFNKVFFPGPPDQWPDVTKEAIKAGAKGGQSQEFLDGLMKQGRDDSGKPRKMPAMWMDMIRRMVIQQLKAWSDIKYPADGIGPDIVVDVNGMKWKTADAFNEIKQALFIQDMERAYTEVVVREALKQELNKHGAFLSDEKFEKLYAKHNAEYEGTLFTLDMIARAFKGYPTLEAYRQRWRLVRSFEDLIAKDINDESLQSHANHHKRFFADGSVNVDVIPFMAKDPFTGGWTQNGLSAAKQRADKAMAAIKGGMSFDAALDKYGEFFINDKDRGHFGSRSLNDLRRQLRENEYTEILDGVSLGYHLYYDAEIGKPEGPLRGADAYYIVRVNARGPATSDVKVTDERTRELVKQDYIAYRFLLWSNDVMARAKVTSVKQGGGK